MQEQDYIMRLIHETVRMIMKLLFNIDADLPTSDLLEESDRKETFEKLSDMIDAGKINEAENLLYDLTESGEEQALEVALLFYSYLNTKEDDFLEAHDYSREEIKLGLKTVIDDYGLNDIAEIFLRE